MVQAGDEGLLTATAGGQRFQVRYGLWGGSETGKVRSIKLEVGDFGAVI